VEWLLSLLLTTLARSKVLIRNRPCQPPCNYRDDGQEKQNQKQRCRRDESINKKKN
jgi:hypothetical protein